MIGSLLILAVPVPVRSATLSNESITKLVRLADRH